MATHALHQSTLSDPDGVASVMGHDAQAALTNTLYCMKVRRAELLGLPVGMIRAASLLRSPCCLTAVWVPYQLLAPMILHSVSRLRSGSPLLL